MGWEQVEIKQHRIIHVGLEFLPTSPLLCHEHTHTLLPASQENVTETLFHRQIIVL